VRACLLVLAACGDNVVVVDATTTCTADFSGNFAESSSGIASCPVLARGDLQVDVPVATLDTSLAIAIELGTPSPGKYSHLTVASWSANALQRIGSGACAYSAGSAAVPSGSFELALAAIEPPATPHGTLALTLAVLTTPGTDCGDADTELVVLRF
jgi:hypothetical protein